MSDRCDRLTELMIISQREFRNVLRNGSVFSYKKMCLPDCEYGFEQFESRLDLSR